MKFSTGDKIILKRTGEEGIVIAIIGNDMVEVSVNGTSFPVYTDEVDHPYLKWFTEKQKTRPVKPMPAEEIPVEKIKNRLPRLAKGIYLSFMPVFKTESQEDIVQELKVFLINELPLTVHFRYDVQFFRQSDFVHQGTLSAFTHIYLHSVDYADMNDRPRFHWELINADRTIAHEEGVLVIKPSKLFEHINNVLFNNQPTFSYLLIDQFRDKPAAAKESAQPVATPPPPSAHRDRIRSLQDIPRYEVDLHIEQLIPSHKGLSNMEIMNIQLSELRKQLQIAIRNRQERMMVIHGLGSGALKEAVHKVLKEYVEISSFSNEWHGKYGFGATEVRFSYG